MTDKPISLRDRTQQLIDDIPESCKTAYMVNAAVKAAKILDTISRGLDDRLRQAQNA